MCYDATAKKTWERTARKSMSAIALILKARGFEVSSVRFNPGGIAVWGEVSFYARKGAAAVYASAYHKETFAFSDGQHTILYRSEEWPAHLGGAQGRHMRSGTNTYVRMPNNSIDIDDVAGKIARQSLAPLGC